MMTLVSSFPARRGVLPIALIATALCCATLPIATASSPASAVRGAAQDTKDTLTFKDSKTEQGKVKSEEFGGVAFEVKGQTRTVLWADLAAGGIAYAGVPEYMAAKDKIDANKFEEAIALLTDLKGTKQRDPIKQNVLYFLPYAAQRLGRNDEALAGYQELLTAFPKSRFLMDVGENLVAIHVVTKDLSGATKALDKLSSDAQAAGVEPSFGSSVNVLKGRLLEEQGKHAEARAAYGIAEKGAGVPLPVVLQAQLGQARCAISLNKKDEAEGLFTKIISQDGPNPVMAGAWNGRAKLMLDAAKDANGGKGDADKMLDAALCYMRGYVLYTPLPGESTQEYEIAMSGASQCFKFLSQLDTKGERGKNNRDYADRIMAQLRREFPNSRYLPN